MAPIVKENDAAVTSPASGNPVNKAAADPSRSQPVALEIPVSVNGARTIEGSDKREPFSESTQTVLVFNNGAVIRLASALASGQLIFLTNDKTKKEVVCQVVKSKNYRTVTGYVELEFTEPAPGFWGMRFPAAAAPPASSISAAPRPVAPATVAPQQPAPALQVPAAPQTISPSAPVAAKPPVSAPAPVPPALIVTKPLIVPPPAAIVTPEPPKAPAPVFENVASHPTPISVVPPPAPVPAAPILTPPVAAVPAAPVAPHTTHTAKPEGPQAPAHDYTKQIAAIFSVPQAPIAPPSAPPAPVAPPVSVKSEPPPQASAKQQSTDELKLQAARLQEQLSAMLFTETASQATSSSRPAGSGQHRAAGNRQARHHRAKSFGVDQTGSRSHATGACSRCASHHPGPNQSAGSSAKILQHARQGRSSNSLVARASCSQLRSACSRIVRRQIRIHSRSRRSIDLRLGFQRVFVQLRRNFFAA